MPGHPIARGDVMKNPWMSVWLSAANSMAAPARGQALAEMHRQQNAMMKAWTEACVRMWMPWVKPSQKRRS